MTPPRLDWRTVRRIALSFAGLAVLLSGCGPGPESQQAAQPASVVQSAITPNTSINELMVAWIDNSSHVLWDVEKPEFVPKDEADWIELEDHAIQLAAAATLIQIGGTGPADPGMVQQAGWRTSAELMGNSAKAALSAARSKNLEALVKANSDLTVSCENCHDAFKPTLPSEGIIHQPPHSASHDRRRLDEPD